MEKFRRWYQEKVFPKKEWLRIKLENNRVFIEFFSIIIISGSAVWVANKANDIALNSNLISEQQMNMSYSENMPLFNLEIKYKEAELIEVGSVKAQKDEHTQYIVSNYGGIISDVYANVSFYLTVYVDDHTLTGDEKYVINLSIPNDFYKNYSYYNYKNNEMIFETNFMYDIELRNIINSLYSELSNEKNSVTIY